MLAWTKTDILAEIEFGLAFNLNSLSCTAANTSAVNFLLRGCNCLSDDSDDSSPTSEGYEVADGPHYISDADLEVSDKWCLVMRATKRFDKIFVAFLRGILMIYPVLNT